MFGRKRNANIEYGCTNTLSIKTPEDTAPCAECGGMFLKSHMYPVAVLDQHPMSSWSDEYYCLAHKKAYTNIRISYEWQGQKGPLEALPSYKRTCQFFNDFEVSEDGTPIGYKKIDGGKK